MHRTKRLHASFGWDHQSTRIRGTSDVWGAKWSLQCCSSLGRAARGGTISCAIRLCDVTSIEQSALYLHYEITMLLLRFKCSYSAIGCCTASVNSSHELSGFVLITNETPVPKQHQMVKRRTRVMRSYYWHVDQANEVKDEGAAIDKLNDLMGENE